MSQSGEGGGGNYPFASARDEEEGACGRRAGLVRAAEVGPGWWQEDCRNSDDVVDSV